ncbi:MAG: hypothetical protein MSC31_14620 [Solirubrobacteraceae bacterium MAG38_C4-C5]|nr:hypothetical protein [Candidatus Siliceabacter maunaloa]
MNASLGFRFTGLHPDVPELCGDLDWLMRFVASQFEVRVGEDLLYDEVEFPVLELAHVLDLWVRRDMTGRSGLDYEATGSEGSMLRFTYDEDDWLVDSDHRPGTASAPMRITERAIRIGIDSFIAALSHEVRRNYGYEVESLLERLRAAASH